MMIMIIIIRNTFIVQIRMLLHSLFFISFFPCLSFSNQMPSSENQSSIPRVQSDTSSVAYPPPTAPPEEIRTLASAPLEEND